MVLPDSTIVPLVPQSRLDEIPEAVRAFDRDTANLTTTVRRDRYIGVIRGRALGPSPGPVLPGPLAPPVPPPDGAVPARLERGRAATQRHRCGFCHNPDMSGHDQIGRIGAQREDYLTKALREYGSGERRGYDPAMAEVARAIGDEEIVDIAHYLAYWR